MEVILEEILILCIGDSKLIGDSLGPLIGSFLERNKSDIGKILIDNTTLCAGSGVNTGEKLIGDISIRGIVGKNYDDIKQNIQELENVSTNLVENMACKIIFKILNLFKV